ncbi:MAG: hypothetical protein MI923_27675 [Phycisphaerales bacterium]|nr:hypothetical protein [Phycisphaerales bacterium]
MSRFTDAVDEPAHGPLQPLPVIDWGRIGQQAPEHLPIKYAGPQAKLPKAEIVIITWTSAEWSAFDHVFLNSDTTRSQWAKEWRKNWHLYKRGAPHSTFSQLWGYYQLVKIGDSRVLLFKAGAHLAHPPWITGLTDMVRCIVEDAQPDRLYSIGTAGGSSVNESLGDVAITNSAHIELKKPENTHVDYNNQSFTCENWFPPEKLLADTQKELFFVMSNVVTHEELNFLLYKLHSTVDGSSKITLNDLLNKPLSPDELHAPKALPFKGKPLLTTDFYYIASGSAASEYVVLEMDDAVIAHEAGQLGVDYAFVRNISDTVVPSQTPGGSELSSEVRQGWSSLIYETFGLYTSFNGALTTWATVAGSK